MQHLAGMAVRRNKTSLEPESQRQLSEIRDTLLALHKALIEYDRVRYEVTMGAISSPNHFLSLVTSDPWFAWLHPLSELIVAIDQVLDESEPVTREEIDTLIRRSGALLAPSEEGEGFGRHYFEALQQEPDVVMAHAAAVKAVRRK